MNYVSSRRGVRVFSLVLLAVFSASAQKPELDEGSNLMLKSRDMHFAMYISQAATGAVAVARQVSGSSKDAAIQALAREIGSDYAKVRSTVDSVTMPMPVTFPDEIPAKELSVLDKVQNSRADRLDLAYLKATRKQALRDIKSCKAEIQKGRNTAIRKVAVETLPVLADHLEKARSLYRAMEKRT